MEFTSLTLIFGAHDDEMTLPTFNVNHLFLNHITSMKIFDKEIKGNKCKNLNWAGYLYLILDRKTMLDEDVDQILNKYNISKIILNYKNDCSEEYLLGDLNSEETLINFSQEIGVYEDFLIIKVGRDEYDPRNINKVLLI